MNNIESNICQAIDIIVQRAIAQADYDKTIQATVIECVDATIGKYKIKYQDSTFYAYSGSSDVSYTEGTAVYVLVPAGNMSKDKTILGAVKKLGTNFVVDNQGVDRYDTIGDDCIRDNETYALQSYYPDRYIRTLYSKDLTSNAISINETGLAQYIKEADSIVCAATFRTSLAVEQQFNGNYGLLISLDFRDNSTGQIITRDYVVDVNKMQGNPYRLVNDTKQCAIFDVDGANYVRVNNVSIFCYDFPHHKPENECFDDIWIKDIELTAAKRMSDEDLNGYAISFVTPRGICFDKTNIDTDTLSIKAQVRVKGKIVDTDSQDIDFYWFVEDVNVTNQSEKYYQYYNQYGGQGWKCLNQSNLISSEQAGARATVQWVPAQDTYTVVKKDVAAKETVFKCVAVYDGIVITKEITIKRLDSQWDISIVSDQGTQFYFDGGKTTLTCLVNGESKPNDYTYCWANVNKDGYFGTMTYTEALNAAYQAAVRDLEQLRSDIANEKVLESQSQDKLNQYENEVAGFDDVRRVDRNMVYNIMANTITSFCVFKCSVYKNGVFLGTGSITLSNMLSAEGIWSLMIHDGMQVFKYNERGVSPTDSSNLKPTVIKPLTFTVYDNLGNPIEEAAINAEDIKWIVPTSDSMLKVNAEGSYVDNEDGTRTYTGLRTLPYQIADSYDIKKQKNDITLEVIYKGMRLIATTDLVFTKQGDAGTNGSDYICRIVPNCANALSEAPMATMNNTTGTVQWNFRPTTANQPFKVQLWHNEELIFDSPVTGMSTEGQEATVRWSMLKNKYSYSVADNSSFTVDEASGEFGYGSFRATDPANILRVKVVHNEVEYYATMPIITAVVNSGYTVKLKKDTGFDHVVYSSDGKQPLYDTSTPFEIIVTQMINGWEEDVSLKNSTYAVNYDWSIIGSIVEGATPERVQVPSLIEASSEGLNKNQRKFKAVDDYDGQCVNNALQCRIYRGNTTLATIHIPIHFMLNRYGNSAVNGWDGNSVNINEEGGFILAPQMGAGQKENDNSYTGVLMGKVKEGLNKEEVGLFGYYFGQRSIFLDAKTGTARFGINGAGQIVMDPSTGKAQLYSGNYDIEKKTGMLIDLTTPEIRYGSGNFVVDKDGKLTAKGEGSSIAGWAFDNDSLYSAEPDNPKRYSKDSSKNTRLSNVPFRRNINGEDVQNNRLAIGSKFGVTEDGSA